MSNQVPLKLSDQEWRIKCEELAKLEVEVGRQEDGLAEEAEEWKDRKSDLVKAIDAKRAIIARLAREVDSRQTMVDPQQSLDMGQETPSEGPPDGSGPPEREPGEDG